MGEQRFKGEADNSGQAEDKRTQSLQVAAGQAPESAELEVCRSEERAAVILHESWSLVTKIASSLETCDRIVGEHCSACSGATRTTHWNQGMTSPSGRRPPDSGDRATLATDC